MPTNHSINYLELPAADLEAIKTFYGTTFGWTFVDYGPEYVAFNDGSFDGGFFKSPMKSRSSENGASLVVLFADDLEATQALVEANGAETVRPIFSFPGGRRFHFHDPAGNELAVWSDK